MGPKAEGKFRPRPKKKPAMREDVPEGGKTVYVGNLRFDKDEMGVRTMMSRYGEVKWVKVIMDPKTGQNKGIAFIEMGTTKEAQKAIKGLDGRVVENRTLKASLANDKRKAPAPAIAPQRVAKADLEVNKKSKEGTVNPKKRKEKFPEDESSPSRNKKKQSGLETLFNYLKQKNKK